MKTETKITLGRGLFFFYLSRGIGLGLRPLALWCALHFGDEAWSLFLARFFFIVPATFIVFNNDSHIDYYKAAFGLGQAGSAREFKIYISNMLSHILLFSIPLFGGFAWYFGSLGMALAFLIFVLGDKIFDEVLRYQLFARSYTAWATCFMLKAILPLAAFVFCQLTGFRYPALTLVILTIAVTVTALMVRTSPSVRQFLIRCLRQTNAAQVLSYFKTYRKRYFVYQLASLAAYNLLAVDKWLGSSRWGTRVLAEVVLVTQFGSAYRVLLDNLFFTVNRDRYVKREFGLVEVVNWPLLTGLSLAALGLFSLVAWNQAGLIGFKELPFITLLMIFFVSVLSGFSRPLEEYTFWHRPRFVALAIDALSMFFMYLGGLLVFSATNLLPLYFVVAGILLLRLCVYVVVGMKKGEAGPAWLRRGALRPSPTAQGA